MGSIFFYFGSVILTIFKMESFPKSNHLQLYVRTPTIQMAVKYCDFEELYLVRFWQVTLQHDNFSKSKMLFLTELTNFP